jgi:acetyl-CoA synthetase
MPPSSADELVARGLAPERAAALLAALDRWRSLAPPPEPAQLWQRLVVEWLRPEVPFAVHQWLFDQVFAGWDEPRLGPRPA